MNKGKLLPLMLCITLLSVCSVSSVVAYLSDQDFDTNTFTLGEVSIQLQETETSLDGDGNSTTNSYLMEPGETLMKDPVVTIDKGSADCWVFVKLDESDNFPTYLSYSAADGWTSLEDANGENLSGVWWRKVESAAVDQYFSVIRNNLVTVNDNVTTEQLQKLGQTDNPYPTLDVTAYAVQCAGIPDAFSAWEYINDQQL